MNFWLKWLAHPMKLLQCIPFGVCAAVAASPSPARRGALERAGIRIVRAVHQRFVHGHQQLPVVALVVAPLLEIHATDGCSRSRVPCQGAGAAPARRNAPACAFRALEHGTPSREKK